MAMMMLILPAPLMIGEVQVATASSLGIILLHGAQIKYHVVARSSTEAEYRSVALATTDLTWICSIFQELVLTLAQAPILWCDNMGSVKLAFNPTFHARTRHIEVDVHYLREKIQEKVLDVRYVTTEAQPVNVLTKPLFISRLLTHCKKLSLPDSLC